jgi:hypothetical protein
MATTDKKGFNVSRAKNGYSNHIRKRYLIKNAYNTALAKGDPVKVSTGYIEIAVNGGTQRGVFDGCKYVDSNGQTKESDYWPAGTSSGGKLEGQTHAIGYVIHAETAYFTLLADASVSALELGLTYPVSVGTPSALYRRSSARMNVSVAASADKNMVRVVGFPQKITTAPDDATTLVEVEFVTVGYN